MTAHSRKVCLVIDDDRGFAKFVQRVAEDLELRVHILTDPSWLEDALAAGDPDVITLDMQMPARHGLDVLQALAARKLEKRVVIISGTPPPLIGDRQVLGGFTVSAVLTKPVRKPEVQVAISRALGLSSS
jgi:CheY-like chemotaxis protein